jgi:hypothetical protein
MAFAGAARRLELLSFPYPRRERWVLDVMAYTRGKTPEVVPALSYSPRERWVRDVMAYIRGKTPEVVPVK